MSKHPRLRYCATCGTALTAEAKFCGYCGTHVAPSSETAMRTRCPNCGKETEIRNHYCPNCGFLLPSSTGSVHFLDSRRSAQLGDERSTRTGRSLTTLEKIGFGIVALALLEFFAIIVVNLIALGPAFFFVLWRMPNPSFEFSLFIPIKVPLFEIKGSFFLIYFFLIIGAIVGSFFWLTRKHGRQGSRIVVHPFKNNEDLAKVAENPLILIGQVFFALMFFNVLYVLILWAIGSSPTTPDLEGGNLWRLLFLLANAAVYEEIIVRVLLLGVPLLILRGVQQRKLTRSTLKKYLWGGGIEIGKVEFLLVCISSVIFGLAHVFSGWGWWKLGQATLGGVVLGYLFLRVGLHSSIALHFSIDYLSVFLLVIEVFNLFLRPSTILLIGIGLVATVLLWLVTSTYYFAMYFQKVLLALRKIVSSKDNHNSPDS